MIARRLWLWTLPAALLCVSCAQWTARPGWPIRSEEREMAPLEPIDPGAADDAPLAGAAATRPAEDAGRDDIRIEEHQPGPGRSLAVQEPAPLASVRPGPGRVSDPYQPPPTTQARRFTPDEGVVLIDRRATVEAVEDVGWVVRFEQNPNAPRPMAPMILLPCALLEGVEDAVAQAGDEPPVFVLTGEVTAYGDQRYFLIHRALRVVESPAGP